MKIYLDRNIFADLKQSTSASRSADDLAILQGAVRRKEIQILLSTTILEETLPALNCSADTLKQELGLIGSLVDWRRMIKTPANLLREAVESYAFDRKLPDMLTRTPRLLEDFITKGRTSQQLRDYLDGVMSQGKTFANDLTEAFDGARQAGVERNVGTPEDFLEFCKGVTPAILEGLCENYGVSARCADRGMEGLLEVRTIKLYATYYAAWAFSKWFGEQGVPGKVKASERGDFFHSVQAAAADVFVTRDAKLARWLKQINVDGFEVLEFEKLILRLAPRDHSN